ncbi:MAG: peptidylprolyl isomerase [Novosphingobium sp.]|uniref:peptidylprolyl isomerase n=1 Tax=Novosphingobium sp. TaxID=1874826 RepID=UPI003C79CF41
MRKTTLALTALLAASASAVLGQASANIAAGRAQPSPLAPSEIVANAPKADWTGIAASDLLVMDLAPDAKGKPRRVVIQLVTPPFSEPWVRNIRVLAKARWWDGMSINRVQDNYVVQWGDPNGDDNAKAKQLPSSLEAIRGVGNEADDFDPGEAPGSGPQVERTYFEGSDVSNGYAVGTDLIYPKLAGAGPDGFVDGLRKAWWGQKAGADPYDGHLNEDNYADWTDFYKGWPISVNFDNTVVVPHCYAMVGVGRDLPPNAGSGAELYTVIGHAPRHLDRNIALVGRVIEGIEHLSSLPRGQGALGFYDLDKGDERVAITTIRMGDEVRDLPRYEFLSTDSKSFAEYGIARAYRRDSFFVAPAGGADICNIPVPVRRVP